MARAWSHTPLHLFALDNEAARPVTALSRATPAFPDGPQPQDPGFFYEGTTGNDIKSGSNGDDGFDYSQGGNDTLNGNGGADEFVFGATFDKLDSVNGGDGDDTLFLDGEYDAPVDPWLATTLVSVEKIVLAAGHFYRFGLSDANVAAGATLTIDGHTLHGATNGGFGFFGGSETDGHFVIYGGKDSDGLFVGYGADVVDSHGGDDVVWCPDSSLQLKTLNGGDGHDTVAPQLSGGATMVLSDTTMKNFEEILFQPDANLGTIGVTLDMADGNVAKGQTFQVTYQGTIGTDISLFFDGSAETDGRFEVDTGDGDDTITGGHGDDRFESFGVGTDRYYGGAGDDYVRAWETWGSTDEFNGGAGNDTLELRGDQSLGVTFGADSLVSVEKIILDNLSSHVLTFNDGNIARNKSMTVDGSGVFGANSVTLNASAETDGYVTLLGGGAHDVLVGGGRSCVLQGNGGDDLLIGGAGKAQVFGGDGDDTIGGVMGGDVLNGGAGHDWYEIDLVSQSTGAKFVEVVGFDAASMDTFAMPVTVEDVDHKVAGGNLRDGANFNRDLEHAIGKNQLDAHHAVLFQPGTGDFVGDTFMIVDANGRAGYQANKDFVVLLTDGVHLAQLDATDFAVPT